MPQASRELAELRTTRDYLPPFEVIRRRVINDYHEGKMTIDATVVIRVGYARGDGAAAVGVRASTYKGQSAARECFPFLEAVKVEEDLRTPAATRRRPGWSSRGISGASAWTTLAERQHAGRAGSRSSTVTSGASTPRGTARLAGRYQNPRVSKR